MTNTVDFPARAKHNEHQKHRSRLAIISAWSVPILVLAQFAFLSVVPIALVLIGTFRLSSARGLRWWAVGLAATYLTPLTIWRLRPHPAPSLSKDISPIFLAAIVVVSVGYISWYYASTRDRRKTGNDREHGRADREVSV